MENKNYKLVNGERVEYSQLEFQEYQNRILNEIKTENKIHNDKLLKLKNKISQEIYEVYPIYKQLDIIGRIGGYTDNDFNEMKAFIEEKIKKYQNSKTIINN